MEGSCGRREGFGSRNKVVKRQCERAKRAESKEVVPSLRLCFTESVCICACSNDPTLVANKHTRLLDEYLPLFSFLWRPSEVKYRRH